MIDSYTTVFSWKYPRATSNYRGRFSRWSRCLGASGEDIEARVGEPVGPDALEESPERGGIGHIGGLGLARTV